MTNIRELPNELTFVVNLKFLNVEYARFLHSIPGQVISSFTMLQVLKMFGCGRKHCHYIEEILGDGKLGKEMMSNLEPLTKLQGYY
ncbi:hypothetical protein CUMW_258740 [Citrus unshiu]|uniref:Uncharacterized protein n=1 Tax=Citrus unshiu TaxID=55188 RepID=A0A2H5QSW7_CITUN|nr:hypothetical protein CUMW_258740 [Citrus unshiu]